MNNKVYTIEDIKVILNRVCQKFDVSKAILFGSYAKNKQTSQSDVDIVIDSQGKLLNIYFYGLLEELVEQFQKKVDLIEISEIEKDSPIYRSIQEEGIVVYERQG